MDYNLLKIQFSLNNQVFPTNKIHLQIQTCYWIKKIWKSNSKY